MSRLTRDGTGEPVSRDQILRRERGQGNIHFHCLADKSRIGNLTRLIFPLAICDDRTYLYRYFLDTTRAVIHKTVALQDVLSGR